MSGLGERRFFGVVVQLGNREKGEAGWEGEFKKAEVMCHLAVHILIRFRVEVRLNFSSFVESV